MTQYSTRNFTQSSGYSSTQFPSLWFPQRRKSHLSFALAGGLLLGAFLLWPGEASAQRVEPMSYALTPSGAAATQSLRVENTSTVDMTLEITASKITLDESGAEARTPAEDDFLIFPPQMILKAGKTQAVRVKYIGDPAITQSAPYRISVRQIPVDMRGEGQSGVGMVVNFHTLADVAPARAKTDLRVNSITRNALGGWDVNIENKGDKLGRLSQTQWVVSEGAKTKEFSSKEVADMTSQNLVLPGKSLSVSIPQIEGFDPSKASIKISDRA